MRRRWHRKVRPIHAAGMIWLRYATCNDDGGIEEFPWVCKGDDGTVTLGFEFLPWSLKSVEVSRNALSGTIQLADLPGKMEKVFLFENQLTGSLDLDSLPFVAALEPQTSPAAFRRPVRSASYIRKLRKRMDQWSRSPMLRRSTIGSLSVLGPLRPSPKKWTTS